MSLLPLVDTGITLTEIPDKISFVITLGNCMRKCKGCHSEYLSYRIPHSAWTHIDLIVNKAKHAKKQGANAILIMGGTTNGVKPEDLELCIAKLAEVLPVGLYSGAEYNSVYNNYLRRHSELTWLKTGEFIEQLGGLDVPGSNQQFFLRDPKSKEWKDATHLFRKD